LLETIKRSFTRQVQLTIQPGGLVTEQVEFLKNNLRKFPGKTRLKVILFDLVEQLRVEMRTTERGFEMNDEMTDFLANNPLIEVQVDTV
jgi:DNA polymerase-3 subunit alpha